MNILTSGLTHKHEDDERKELNQIEIDILLTTRITTVVVSVLLLICTCIVIYAYIIKKSKYQDIGDLLFYINAVLIILMIGIEGIIYDIPYENICSLSWLIICRIPEFLNYNLGIC